MFKQGKYIILKERNNLSLVIGTLVISIVVIILATSKMWMPDDRPVMSKNNHAELVYPMNTVNVGDYYRGLTVNIGEIHLTETKINPKEEYDVTYTVLDEQGNELPSKVIKGNLQKETEQSAKSIQDVIVQFSVYKDFYYVTVRIAQGDGTIKDVVCDYRNFVSKDISEKGTDYLVSLSKMESDLTSCEKDMESLKKQQAEKETALKALEALTPEEQENKKEELETMKAEIAKLQEEIKSLQAEYDDLNKQITALRE